MARFDEKKNGTSIFFQIRIKQKQSEIKGRKMEKINKEVLQINEKHA